MKSAASSCLAVMTTAVLSACSMPRDTPPDGSAPNQSTGHTAATSSSPTRADVRAGDTGEEIVIISLDGFAPESSMAEPVLEAIEAASVVEAAPAMSYQLPADTEKYQHQNDNPVHLASERPFSTFAIDVDTGAYANVRRFLNSGQLPPQDAVRVEELLNYFDYRYAPPRSREQPFSVSTELAPSPWNAEALLLRIGIKGFEVVAEQRPAANLVFLVDVSGSMETPDKLPLLKSSLRLLSEQLTARDRVSMVVYAGNTGVVLAPTPGDQKARIQAAIERLEAGGSTNGGDGIRRAYRLAREAQIKEGINRVVLATDGDFNVGMVDFEALIDLAERQRASGVALTTLGFGTGNYNDQLLERLADAGNGNYAYVDTLAEARKVLVSELSSTLFTIAKDVKIQVEFNPAEVREYRLIGYENRGLKREDFNNDRVDAGEIGAGHRVTALYEIVKADGKGLLDPPRYSASAVPDRDARNGELALLRLRYKRPEADDSQLIELPIMGNSVLLPGQASADFRFAASVAAFGQLLRGGKYTGKFTYDDVTALASTALGDDVESYRTEFVALVKQAQALTPMQLPSGERANEAR